MAPFSVTASHHSLKPTLEIVPATNTIKTTKRDRRRFKKA